MKNEGNYSSLLQVVALIILFLFFIWENRKVSPEDQLFFWIFFSTAIIVVAIIFGYSYLKDKLDKVKVHEEEIQKLKEQISIGNKFNDIYFQLGKLTQKKRE